MIIFQLQNLNARLILNAHTILHVYRKNVKIRAIQALVALMLSVKPKIIEQYVFVFLDL